MLQANINKSNYLWKAISGVQISETTLKARDSKYNVKVEKQLNKDLSI